MSSVELSQNAKAFTQGHVKCYATDVDAHATVVYDQMVSRYSTGQAMCHYGADHVHRLLREQAHLRGPLESASSRWPHNRNASRALKFAVWPMKVWRQHHHRWAIGPSSRPEPPKCATPPREALSLCSDRSDTLNTWALAGWQARGHRLSRPPHSAACTSTLSSGGRRESRHDRVPPPSRSRLHGRMFLSGSRHLRWRL